MYIVENSISCGIGMLCDVGSHPLQSEYYDTMINCVRKYAIILASLTTHQKYAAKFLRKNGFVSNGRAIINPNSDNRIILFVKKTAPRERLSLYRRAKRENGY